jgi:hypothetical protein
MEARRSIMLVKMTVEENLSSLCPMIANDSLLWFDRNVITSPANLTKEMSFGETGR